MSKRERVGRMEMRIGDMLARRVKGPIRAHHYGIYLGAWGSCQDAVFHNSLAKGCRVAPLSEFAAGKPVWIAAHARELSEVFRRTESLLGRRYRPIRLNCETAANYVHSGVAFSQSVAKAAIFLLRLRTRIHMLLLAFLPF